LIAENNAGEGLLCLSAGSEAISEMITLGWLTPDKIDGNQILPVAAIAA
jgi:hypothetical protein